MKPGRESVPGFRLSTGMGMRGGAWRRWYKTARWKRLRLQTFERDGFSCRRPECRRLEGDTSLLICDHVEPHRGDERRFFDPQNLQTLCKPCHDSVKQREEQASIQQRGVWD